ncbi:hypothetical protein DZA50_01315 [Kangiella sp. HD9-110m-PIT-SAG07]|nr:hypothetical protein DZA50_01315 [Kangiella sp. HD9-110m-PIT-SAG07]
MQQQAATKRSWLRRAIKTLLWILAILTLALAIAYWTAPSWAPGQVQKFLPASIKLQDLEFKRPGLTSTKIDRLSLTLGGDTQYTLIFNDVDLGYSLWQRKLTSISAQKALIQWQQTTTQKTDGEALQQIPLPQLPVSEISIGELTVEGLTLQNIIARNIQLKDNQSTVRLDTEVFFLDKTFSIAAQASRNNQHLSSVKANIRQAENTLTIQAAPRDGRHWEFETKGMASLDDIYPEPGIEPVKFSLFGAVNVNQTIQLTLDNTSQIATHIDAKQLGLLPALQTLLKQNQIATNIEAFSPSYAVSISPLDTTLIHYHSANDHLSMAQGQLEVQANNPDINAKVRLSDLDINLNKALTAEMQQMSALVNLDAKGLSGKFQSAEHKASSNNIQLSAQINATLANSALTIDNAKAQLHLAPVSYQGNNSTASITKNSWGITGSSRINFNSEKTSTHQWKLSSQEPINSTLSLDKEQFTANKVSAELSFNQNSENPQGLLSGSYQSAEVSLQQQPLRLNKLKGTLQFPIDKSPQGQITFDNARYRNQQIGVSNISGELDWIKKTKSFMAQGSLHHQSSKIPFTYEFNLADSRHNLKVKQSSLPVSTITGWVNVLKNYPQLRFNSGQLEIDSLDGDPIGLLFDGNLKLDNFNLSYDEFYIKNWTIEDSLTPSSKLGGTLKSHIESIELATDIAITDVSFLMPHTINSLIITNLKGHLLKGTIEIPRLAIDDDGIPPFTAYLKAIDINALLSALNSEKLKLTGRFDFTLPLTISKKGQQITNGQFKALGNGVINLKSDKGEKANIAFQALENFYYKEFSGAINYNLAGDYTIELSVLGANPNLYNGFPIKLDLTLRGQLPEMLYSMIISGDMTKPILDDLQQRKILNIQQ